MLKKEPSVFLLAGTEQFLKDENLARIKSAFLDKDSDSFNFNVFYAGTVPLEQILECAHTLPFLGRKRVVLLRQIEDLSASEKDRILSYIKTQPSIRSTCLILETSESNLNQNFFAEICKYAQVIFCKPLRHNQLFAWIKTQAEAKDKRIEEKAKAVLVDNLGSDLQLLSGTLDNLTLYIGKRETIEVEDVQKLMGRDLTTSVFALFDAVVARDKVKVLQILESLLKDGINSSQILGALTHKIVSERNRLNPSQFEQTFEQLQKTDSDIKAGRQNQRLALELLLIRLLYL